MTLDVSLFELEVFTTLSTARSVRAAARQLKLKPSHVSKVLTRLEAKLGKELALRSPTGIVLNREGVILEEVARKILRESAALADGFKLPTAANPAKTVLTIGGLSYVNRSLLAGSTKIMESFDESLRFRFLDIAPDKIIAAAVKGAFDLAIHTSSDEWPNTWTITKIGDAIWSLYSRTGHPLGTHATAEEVNRYPFVIPTYWDGKEYLRGDDYCKIPISDRTVGHEASTADLAAQIVKTSDQLGYLPRLGVIGYVHQNELTEISVREWEVVKKPLYLAVKSDKIKKKLYNSLVVFLRHQLGIQ